MRTGAKRVNEWKREVPVSDGWYWFRPDGGVPSPYDIKCGRVRVAGSNSTFDISASALHGEWNDKKIKVPK